LRFAGVRRLVVPVFDEVVFGVVAFEVVLFDAVRFEVVPFEPLAFEPLAFELLALADDGFDALDRDVFELDDLERLRFGLSFPIGSALPTAFTASPAASPTVPAIFPAVRPTVLTTFPGSGIGCPPSVPR
jgi:hypothetical protein